MINLILKHEDHIDLKHKLNIIHLIKYSSLNEYPNLLELANLLNVFDDNVVPINEN